MTTEPLPIEVRFTDDFRRQIRNLAKRYRQIQADIQPLIEQLQIGQFVGDQIPGVGYTVFKVRVRNSDIQKGKSAGYRLVYQIESPTTVLLLLVYSKSDKTDVAADEIRAIIDEFYGGDKPD